MKSPSLRERARFWFDGIMTSGRSLWFVLALLVALAAVFVGLLLSVGRIAPEGEEPVGFFDGVWQALSSFGVADSSPGWPYRLLMSAVVVGNLFIGAAIFILVWAFAEKTLDNLRKGRSRVIAEDHTIILNWSPSIFDVISELVAANASRRRPRIAILANKDKADMDDEIAEQVSDLRNSKVITRTGDPTSLSDLGIMSVQSSRSVIVLSPEDEESNPDSQVIKSVLAIVHDPQRRPEPYNITAEIREAKNVDIAHAVGGIGLQVVLADEFLARVLVQSVRQSGLSLVYSELLDFEGCEIYTLKQPELVGKTFDFAIMAYENCTPIGLVGDDGAVRLNPPGETIIESNDRLIIVAEDDSTVHADPSKAAIDELALVEPAAKPHIAPERTLILGWNRRGPIVARELASFAGAGSLLTIAADTPEIEDDIEALDLPPDRMSVQFHRIHTADSTQLDLLDIASYDHVLVLGYSDTLSPQQADTQTMITLLQLRSISDKSAGSINVASEMIDIRNRELAAVTRADDFVVSNQLISLMLAQASENPTISAIFKDLLNEEGSELYLRPATDYVTTDKPVNFYTVSEAARRRGQVALGYRLAGDQTGGVVVNPAKRVALQYENADQIIVLSKN